MSKVVTLRLDEPVYKMFRSLAKGENRPVSNFIETAVLRFVEEHQVVDEFEMAEIRSIKSFFKEAAKCGEAADIFQEWLLAGRHINVLDAGGGHTIFDAHASPKYGINISSSCKDHTTRRNIFFSPSHNEVITIYWKIERSAYIITLFRIYFIK